MNITRRSAISGFIASACCPVFARALDEPEAAVPVVLPSPAPGWTAAWDRKLLNGLMQRMNSAYDPAARMSRAYRGPEYNLSLIHI